jgi:hypothetical protein
MQKSMIRTQTHPALLSMQCPTQSTIHGTVAYPPPGYYLSSSACSAQGVLREPQPLLLTNALGGVAPTTFDCQALPKCTVRKLSSLPLYCANSLYNYSSLGDLCWP